jgi:tRNA G10  N-methylase Trm11
MINLATSSCDTNAQKPSLFDPVAGKGTTLYDALMLGYNAYGIEILQKYFEESCHYAAKFMQKEKFKHTTKKDRIFDVKSIKISDAYTLEFAPDKKSFAAKDTGIFKIFSADTRIADRLIKKNTIDMLVGDLPYGIQHANRKNAKKQMARSAEELLVEAMPKWYALLKPGASLVLSFNEPTTHKKNLEHALKSNGMVVLDEDKYTDYRHRVDSSIVRDVIVAVKPK